MSGWAWSASRLARSAERKMPRPSTRQWRTSPSKDFRESGEESVAARPGVGQRLERDDEDPRRLDLAAEAARRGLAEVAAGGDIVGAEIDAAGLRRRLRRERGCAAAAPSAGASRRRRLRAAAARSRRRRRWGERCPPPGAAVPAQRSAPLTLDTPPWLRRSAPSLGEPRDVAADGDLGHPPSRPARSRIDATPTSLRMARIRASRSALIIIDHYRPGR